MDYPDTIGRLLGLGSPTVSPEVGSHPWNQLLGIELELEDVTTSSGSSIYNDYEDFNPYALMSEDEWEDMSYTEQDDYRERWYQENATGIPSGWTTHLDASLRNGIEFVTTPAVGGEALVNRINSFYECNYNYKGGPRTSTHIHVDVTNDNPTVVQSLVMLVYAVEDALYNLVDPGRKWAGYSAALAEMPTSRLRNLLNPLLINQFVKAVNVPQNRDRYYGLNFHVGRHGTVEFRYFPGAPTKEELTSWVDLVVAIKKTAQQYSPDQMVNICSSPQNFAHFLESNLGYWGTKFLANKGADDLFAAFEEVVALRSDDANPERTSTVAVLPPVLVSLILKKYMEDSPSAKEYLDACGIPGKALSIGDTSYYIATARNIYSKLGGKPIATPEEETSWPPEEISTPTLSASTARRTRNTTDYINLYRQIQRAHATSQEATISPRVNTPSTYRLSATSDALTQWTTFTDFTYPNNEENF